MPTEQTAVNHERVVNAMSGGPMVVLIVVLLIGVPVVLITSDLQVFGVVAAAVFLMLAVISLNGFFSLQPNEARVLILFGRYKGTVRNSGLRWTNPFYSNGRGLTGPIAALNNLASGAAQRSNLGRYKVSLRARVLNGEPLKVNDKSGNPIEIGAVVVWRVEDTAQAFFDVDDYGSFVPVQSESALRHIANMYSYDDNGGGTETTLRSNVEELSAALRAELQERCAKAGVAIDEARLSHLAYAPEIAQVMLRRQQAEAVIAARKKIVQGAVGMVEMALSELASKEVVQLDDERRAAMVSNLMVVLCSESGVHPVVNTGTLYS
jgi:regulator of protease activity HflC (stomatin/prohibitin superfamily)